jgi:type IV pilus assembly protein PilY1
VLKKIGLSGGGGTGGTATPALCVPSTILPTYPYCNADPVGLAKINVQLESNETDNTALFVYGGDLKGRMWKWDISSEVNTSYGSAAMMATALAPDGTAQPITTKPEIGRLPSFEFAIFFGTGRYLGNSDPSNLQRQTVYAIKGSLSGVANARSVLVAQTLGSDQAAAGGTVRTVTSTNDVNWTTGNGWYIDLPVSGERVNVDPSLQIGTLVIASNAPTSGDCSVGGVGYLNYFDYLTGRAVVTSTGLVASYKVPGSLIVGTNTVKLPGNKLVTITTTADNQQLSFETPISLAGAGGKRISWREVIVD